MVALALFVAALPWAALTPTDAATPGAAPAVAAPRAARAAQAARAAAADRDPLSVVIKRLTPSTVPDRARDRITVTGRVVNRSDSTWTGVQVYLLTSYDPLTTAADLEAALTSDPRLDLGGNRIITPGLFEDVPDLGPGDSTPFKLTVKRSDLVISGEPGSTGSASRSSARAGTSGSRARTAAPAPSCRWCRRTPRPRPSRWDCSSAATSCARPPASCSTSPPGSRRWRPRVASAACCGSAATPPRSRSPGSSTLPCFRPPSPSHTGTRRRPSPPTPARPRPSRPPPAATTSPRAPPRTFPRRPRSRNAGCAGSTATPADTRCSRCRSPTST